MLKKYLNRSLLALSAVAIGAISAFAVGGEGPSQVDIVLQKPTIVMSGVQGTARVVSIVKAVPTDSVVYRTSDTIATYHDPFLVEKTDMILARTCATDTVYDAKGNQIVKHYYSAYDTLMVKAGTEVKLNPVTFDQNMVELVDDLSYITLHTDQSDVLLSPEATIMYRMTNRTWIEVPNDSTVLSNEGTIAAYAKAPGYANSDTTYYNVKIQRIEYVGVPSLEILEHNADGSKKLLIKNTVKGYPVPTIYYSFPAGAEPVALEDSILVTPAGSYGWLQVYADAPGYDASAANRIYLDNRTVYKQPYVTVLPGDTAMATVAGDLELWNVQDLDVTNYPEQAVQVSGQIIYHQKMHSNYNTLVLPFLYSPNSHVVTDGTGKVLEFGKDFKLYELSSTISAERLAAGSLDATQAYPFKSYLIQVSAELIGSEFIFRSTPGTNLEVTQNSFTAASSSLTIIPNARAQKHQLASPCYILNAAGTAFELNDRPALKSFEPAIFAPLTYREQHASISLVYQPELVFDPANDSDILALDTTIVMAPNTVSRLELMDPEYQEGGLKSLQILKNGTSSSVKAQLKKKNDKSYYVITSSKITDEARYTIKFPEGLFGFFLSGNNTGNPDHLSVETGAIYNVMSPTTVTIDPAQGTQTSLKDFTMTFNKQIGLNNQGLITFENASGDTIASFSADYIRNHNWIGSKTLKVSLPATIKSGGSYVLRVPAGFLTLSGVFTNSEAFVFNYSLPVVRNYHYFADDMIMWTNYDNISAAYNEGWVCSDTVSGHFTFDFETIPDYIMLIDPVTRSTYGKAVSTVKVSNREGGKLHFMVKNVKSVLFYVCNTGSWPYALDVRGVSSSGIYTTFVSVDSYRSDVCQIDINPDEEFTVTAYSNALPLNVYAVEFVYRNGSIAGIESVMDDAEADGRIYDLQGREVAEPVKGHIYVRDGKKFIMK